MTAGCWLQSRQKSSLESKLLFCSKLDKPARLTIRLVLDLFLMVRRVWQPLWSGCKILEGRPLTENSLNLTENDWLALPRTWSLGCGSLDSLNFVTKCLKTTSKSQSSSSTSSIPGKCWQGFVSEQNWISFSLENSIHISLLLSSIPGGDKYFSNTTYFIFP